MKNLHFVRIRITRVFRTKSHMIMNVGAYDRGNEIMISWGKGHRICNDNIQQMHERYMASDTRCPISYIFKLAVEVDGAAAPKGSMTYDFTQDNFLRVSESVSLRVSGSPSPPPRRV